MKIKIVVKLFMNDEKSRRKALVISGGTPGVESAALTGPERNQVEVVGEGIDPVVLTRKLRKKVAPTEIVSLAEVKKPEPAKAPPAEAAATTAPPQPPEVVLYHVPPPQWNEQFLVGRYDVNVMGPRHDPSCTIL